MKKLKIFSDGCSRGNHGPAGVGYLIFDENGRLLSKKGKYVGMKTNNEAEYLAAIEALREALALGASEVELLSDSELLVKQVRGSYAVKSDRLAPLHEQLIDLIKCFKNFTIKHVGRGENRGADRLAKLVAGSSLQI